jgi:PilZ domain
MNRESRKVQRFAVQLPCTLWWNNEDRSEGTVLNLSAGGCAITSEPLPSVSDHVSLHIDLVNGDERVAIELAGVRWVSEHRCGLEFIRVQPDMLMKLRAFALLLEQTP